MPVRLQNRCKWEDEVYCTNTRESGVIPAFFLSSEKDRVYGMLVNGTGIYVCCKILKYRYHVIIFYFSAKDTKGRWAGLGEPLPDNGWYGSLAALPALYYRPYVVLSCQPVTHDTRRLVLRPKRDTRLLVPPGRHVQFRRTILLEDVVGDDDNSMEIIRSYTPVPRQFAEIKEVPEDSSSDNNLYFLVKIYPSGALTPTLGRLQPGDTLDVSDPAGNFIPSSAILASGQVAHVTVYLLAAGTGITPMLSILPTIQRAVAAALAAGQLRRVVLLYFNRSEQDIICRSELEEYATQHAWLEVTHVLSEDPTWAGRQGRVRRELLAEHMAVEVGRADIGTGNRQYCGA